MNITKKKTALLALALAALVATVSAYVMWTFVTKIKVEEPFSVETDLIPETTLLPGIYHKTINVTNTGGIDYNATLWYYVETNNCNILIEPENGTWQVVPAGKTVTFDINITVDINGYPEGGTATITWTIDRSSVVAE